MEVSDNLQCLFTGQIEEEDGSYVVEIPEREVNIGDLEPGQVSRVAILPQNAQRTTPAESSARRTEQKEREAPVEEGEIVEMEIEDIGDKGDGIARIGPGYVVIVSDTEQGERVSARMTEVRENMAFADVVKRHDQRA